MNGSLTQAELLSVGINANTADPTMAALGGRYAGASASAATCSAVAAWQNRTSVFVDPPACSVDQQAMSMFFPYADSIPFGVLLMSLGYFLTPRCHSMSLLDAIRYAETGHLSPEGVTTARSDADAVGPYQFLRRTLHDMGYGMPKNIPLSSMCKIRSYLATWLANM